MPGQTAQQTFTIDTDKNSYFSFAGMVVPSNDFLLAMIWPMPIRWWITWAIR